MRKQEMLVVKHITRCALSQGPTPCRTLTATPTRKLFIPAAYKNDLPTANNSSLPSTTRTSSSARISGSTFATCFAKTFPPFRINGSTPDLTTTLSRGGLKTRISLLPPSTCSAYNPSLAFNVASSTLFSLTCLILPVLNDLAILIVSGKTCSAPCP